MPGVVGDGALLLLIGGFSMREGLCVRSCCFMLSLRVNALLQVGQWMFFSPVCFFPWRAAWPDVVKVSRHAYLAAWGQGYFFFGGLLPVGVFALVAAADMGEDTEE